MNELQLNSSNSMSELSQQLMLTTDPAETTEILSLFNTIIKKKEIIRTGVFAELQDKVADQIGKRLDQHADEFSNKDLLGYLTAIQNILTKPTTDTQEITNIAIQQNTVNIDTDNIESLSKDSRDRIKAAIDAIMSGGNINNNQSLEGDIVNEQ